MDVIEHRDQRVIHLNYPSQYALCSSFIRIQEFYESPFEGIKGCEFTLDSYMDKYAAANGNFTYFSDWAGFNIPGNVFLDFMEKFGELRDKEEGIVHVIRRFYLRDDPQFYLIGTYGAYEENNRVIRHELAHAWYYLSEEYRQSQDSLIDNLGIGVICKATSKLLGMGYDAAVVWDEIQAYCSTDDVDELMERFGLTGGDIKGCHHLLEKFTSNLKAYL
jgi:hypothetical protein